MATTFHDEALDCSPAKFGHGVDIPTPPKRKNEEPIEIPLSPDSRKYQLKMSLLQEKYEEVFTSTEILKNRLMQVQKEITEHQRIKRMLVCSLEAKGDQYYKGRVEFLPEQEWKAPPPSVEDLEKERKKRERRERDRIRERARKQARREAEKKAKLEAELAAKGLPIPVASTVAPLSSSCTQP